MAVGVYYFFCLELTPKRGIMKKKVLEGTKCDR